VTLAPVSPWEAAARLFEPPPPKPRRWASPLDMAQQLDSTIVRTPALNLINEALVDVADGREDRLMVCMPPQEAKSTTVAYRFPQWLLADIDADLRCLVISYSDEIARRWGADIKRDFETFDGTDDTIDLGVRLRADSRAAGRWQVEGFRGGVVCAGVAGSISGRPADLCLIDDPIKDLEQAQSPLYRERFQRFWQAVAVPRLGPNARAVLISTRWHEEDAAGWLLQHEGRREDGGRWKVINIPAISEGDGDPLGRPAGQPMVSARGNRDWAGIRKSVGEYVWASLYQQRPAPAEGGLFRRIWWRHFTPAGEGRLDLAGRLYDLRDCWRFATVDLAASTRTAADYTVIAAWARTISGDLVLLDMLRARIGEHDHFKHARPLVERWQLDTVFVEAGQYGTTLVREATQQRIPISPLQAETDKFSRALPYSAWVSSGRVWLPANADWRDAWVSEHAAFPNSAHDDMVDTGSMAVRVAVTKWAPPPATPRLRTHDDGIDLARVSL
jgi:predicted phage terminase large subunit-like protein